MRARARYHRCVRLWPVLVLSACSRPAAPPRASPTLAVAAVEPASLCVTMGALSGTRVDAPTFRAVAPAHAGDAAYLRFKVHGDSTEHRALASGQLRRQVGLKLRAADGCNLVYVMWRRDPKPGIEVSVKRNEGAHTGKECGNAGYTKLAPTHHGTVPALDDEREHELRAEIAGDVLTAWIDGALAWQGTLPDGARDLTGAPGVRSDNLSFDIVAFGVDERAGSGAHAKCRTDDGE